MSLLDRVAKSLFFISLALLTFLVGVVVGRYQVFPYPLLQSGKKSLAKLFGITNFSEWKPHHLMPTWYDYSGVKIYNGDRLMPGVILITGYWKDYDWKQGIRLIDAEGNTLNHWVADPTEIWPENPYNDWGSRGEKISNSYVHGSYLFNNGDVLFNLEYIGLVRMNSRGEILWKLPYRTHHSVARDDSGHFWVCGLKWEEEIGTENGEEKYLGLKGPIGVDYAVQVSEDGKILREINLLKVIYESGYQRLLWQMSGKFTGELLHANDVEPLLSSMADNYPFFEANDLLVSCRYLNTIFIIDGKTEKIKWLASNFSQQHDPDFQADGSIIVFDNNYDGSEDGNYLGGTRIIRIWPDSSSQEYIYPVNLDTQHFYTPYGGKAQRLENNNLLITEAGRGRIFEVDPQGNVLWEWVSEPFNEELTPEILEGTRYPYTEEQVKAWQE